MFEDITNDEFQRRMEDLITKAVRHAFNPNKTNRIDLDRARADFNNYFIYLSTVIWELSEESISEKQI